VVAQDQAFAFGPQGGGEAVAFFFGEDDAVEFLRMLSVSHTSKSKIIEDKSKTGSVSPHKPPAPPHKNT
jgi:hypothetical protein